MLMNELVRFDHLQLYFLKRVFKDCCEHCLTLDINIPFLATKYGFGVHHREVSRSDHETFSKVCNRRSSPILDTKLT
jgi:hypothetical protein